MKLDDYRANRARLQRKKRVDLVCVVLSIVCITVTVSAITAFIILGGQVELNN